jgi:hypothetical protein
VQLVDKLELRVFVGCREEEMEDFQPVTTVLYYSVV